MDNWFQGANSVLQPATTSSKTDGPVICVGLGVWYFYDPRIAREFHHLSLLHFEDFEWLGVEQMLNHGLGVEHRVLNLTSWGATPPTYHVPNPIASQIYGLI